MPYVFIDDEKLKEFDPEGKLKTLPEDTADKMASLESKANELLGEKKKLQRTMEEKELDYKKQIDQLHSSKGTADTQKLLDQLEDAKRLIAERDSQYEELQGSIRKNTISAEAAKIAARLTKDTAKADLLTKQLANRITLDGDNIVVLDESGKPTISSLSDLEGSVKTQYPFLVDASPASGGGATGSSSGAATSKEMPREAFDKLDNFSKAKFAREGGKVVEN